MPILGIIVLIVISMPNYQIFAVSQQHSPLMRANIRVGATPVAIAVNPSTNMIYVANSDDNTSSVINGASESVVTKITTGHDPEGIAVNPSTNMMYVANSDDDTVSVIDGRTNAVVKSIAVGSSPIAVAVNPSTNIMYVAEQ